MMILILCTLLFGAGLVLGQQHQQYHQQQRVLTRETDSPHVVMGINDSGRNYNRGTDVSSTVRALATVSPGSASSSSQDPRAIYDNKRKRGLGVTAGRGSGGGISSIGGHRSLNDWEVEDFVLLATVDGTLHARDRKSGVRRWEIFAHDPVVQTVYHRANGSTANRERDWIQDDDVVWIVEPIQDGALFFFTPDNGLQKLDVTVKDIVDDLSPFTPKDGDRSYNGEKKTTTFAIDARTGNVQRVFSSAGVVNPVNNDKCKPNNGLEEDLDDDECESVPKTILIGRTEYTVTINSLSTGERLWTIKYAEWGPNNGDRDLAMQYERSMDNRYIYSGHDGKIYGFEGDVADSDGERRPKYQQAFSSPVIRVFDVVKSINSPTEPTATTFVVLPQPILASREFDGYEGLTYVGCTENDGFYALSETSYPYVTDGALDATFYTSGRLNWQTAARDERHKTIMGTHRAHYRFDEPYRASLPAPTPISREERSAVRSRNSTPPFPSSPSLKSSRLISFAMENLVDISIVVPIVTTLIWLFMRQLGASKAGSRMPETVSNATMANHAGELVRVARSRAASEGVSVLNGLPDGVVVMEEQLQEQSETTAQQEQGEEAVAVAIEVATPKEEVQQPIAAPEVSAGAVAVRFEEDAVMVEEDAVATPAPTPKKKKAHRGQRGGARKRGKANAEKEREREKEKMEIAVNEVKEVVRENPMQVDLNTLSLDPLGEEWDSSSLVAINNLMVHEDKVLGVGSQGTIVYRGSFEGKVVAVKRMLRDFIDVAEHEVSLLQQSDDHPNVIRYYCTQHGTRFLYIALELCPASLFDIYSNPIKHSDLLELMDPIDVLRQIALGIHHLHSLKIVHRDLKPHNILVSHPKPLPHDSSTKRPRILISDFGLCKKLEGDKSSFGATTAHAAGTSGWRAPELLVDEDSASKPILPSQPPAQPSTAEASSSNSSSETAVIDTLTNRRATRAIDIFSLGCVFYYILSRGEHPFGTRWHREFNIINNSPDLSHLSLLGLAEYEAKDLISGMISHNPRKRPDATKVLIHPFFWSPEKQLTFLLDVSDRFEVEKDKEKVTGPDGGYKSPFIPLLERNAREVCGGGAGDWMKKLDRLFLGELVSNKRRGYDGEKVLDLLRAIRNKKHHYQDMKQPAKEAVGDLPDGYLSYFSRRFPGLLLHACEVVRDAGFWQEPVFRGYYSVQQ
ncbi:hypothetical protein L873DRAFT_1793233 [Choiromyces venosus 120613-1]|uniref:non-specific serine/threonine protein kinase n=1 Tax=Choiromyces venosus 120613-1 TaxID=1336337 RepID=A0A3N4JBA2_9PEZI|nr:hypothetical protein L873DRAFT_1793233 [Choiromyces venosus 120613-1]